jgi:hypothetical protein
VYTKAEMKRLIRKTNAEDFLKADGTWTKDFAEARDFPNILAASKFQQQNALVGVELLLVVGDSPSAQDSVFRLPPEGSKPAFYQPPPNN